MVIARPVSDDMKADLDDDTELESYCINAALFGMIKDFKSKHPADFQIVEKDDDGDGGDDEDEDDDDEDKDDEDEDDDGKEDN